MDAESHRKELLDLGFPPKAIDEAVRARAHGLFAFTPSPAETEEAVRRIMERIAPLLPPPRPGPSTRRFRVIPRGSRGNRKV